MLSDSKDWKNTSNTVNTSKNLIKSSALFLLFTHYEEKEKYNFYISILLSIIICYRGNLQQIDQKVKILWLTTNSYYFATKINNDCACWLNISVCDKIVHTL